VTAVGVVPGVTIFAGTGSATLLAVPRRPDPSTFLPTGLVVFTWTFSGDSIGDVYPFAQATGTDFNTGSAVVPTPIWSMAGTESVVPPGSLEAALRRSAAVSVASGRR